MSGDQYTAAQFQAAKQEPVVLSARRRQSWIAPHFVWAVRDELTSKLCGPDATPATPGAGRPAGHHDARRRTAEDRREVGQAAAARSCRTDRTRRPAAAKALGLQVVPAWMREPREQGCPQRRARRARLPDRRTGRLRRQRGLLRDLDQAQFQPQYDVVGKGYRQPGSAFKPFNYATAIDDKKHHRRVDADGRRDRLRGRYTPNDADNLERGPVRVRNALQFSLNIPSVKTMAINTPDHVFAKAKEFGMQFQTHDDAGSQPRARCRRDAGRWTS